MAVDKERVRISIQGAVQGVGFRPFVYRLATEMDLAGWVVNSSQGVRIEAEGKPPALRVFLERLKKEIPPRASIYSIEFSFLDPGGYSGFQVRESDSAGEKTAVVLPDIAVCAKCAAEIRDPADRRFRYPFTNCTDCGPRYSIIHSVPYDRANTTMSAFTMCEDCRAEYDDLKSRRFHAQPNACPVCGPKLELWDGRGGVLAAGDEALLAAAVTVRRGGILALKGLGGFHLITDAQNEEAARRLRRAKNREEKPFALMFPSLAQIEAHCELTPEERNLLLSPASPIVLLKRGLSAGMRRIAPSVAPGNPDLGAMLPYTPLHCLLFDELNSPAVATSGNIKDEPICTDERDALERLNGVADAFLVHDRRIARPVDDSVCRIVMGRPLVLRRARGYAPLPVFAGVRLPKILAMGAHLKSSVAIASGSRIFASQHLGDLETMEAVKNLKQTTADFCALFGFEPERVACDLHPDYASTRFAASLGAPLVRVQHHYAHVLACMADNDLRPPLLGVSWDGTGLGPDGTVWGGEFIRITPKGWERVAHLRQFPLPGGDKAAREPRRSALGLLHEMLGPEGVFSGGAAAVGGFGPRELKVLGRMLGQGLNSPRTSSAGRLFDAVSSLLGLRHAIRYEGQAAMELEWAAGTAVSEESYPFELPEGTPARLDWEPAVRAIMHDMDLGAGAALIARKFHNTLADMIIAVARAAGEERVLLTGGCFQNLLLTELAFAKLLAAGLRPYRHQLIPPNDGGIAAGQALACAD